MCPDDLAIYDHFWRLCRRVSHGNDCDGRPIPTLCRRVPEEWEPVVAHLLETFGEGPVEASGIAKREEDGRWTLTRALAPGSMLVAFREGREEPIFEILTPRGGLVGERLPIIAALQDHRFVDWIPKTGHRLLACVSTPQVPPLLAQALPATTLSGLTDLDSQGLCRVWRQLGWGLLEPHQRNEPAANPVRPILVDWDPRRRQAGPLSEVRRAAEFLANAGKYLRVDMSHCGVWFPDESELEKCRFCRRVGDLNASREALVESIDNSSFAVSAYATPGFVPRRKPGNVIEAYTELERCLDRAENRPVTAKRLQEAEESFQRLVEVDLVQPLQQQALESCDPMERSLGVVAADTSRLLHRQAPYLARDVLSLAKGSLSLQEQKRVLEQVSRRERQIANLIRLAELQGR